MKHEKQESEIINNKVGINKIINSIFTEFYYMPSTVLIAVQVLI